MSAISGQLPQIVFDLDKSIEIELAPSLRTWDAKNEAAVIKVRDSALEIIVKIKRSHETPNAPESEKTEDLNEHLDALSRTFKAIHLPPKNNKELMSNRTCLDTLREFMHDYISELFKK